MKINPIGAEALDPASYVSYIGVPVSISSPHPCQVPLPSLIVGLASVVAIGEMESIFPKFISLQPREVANF